MLEPLDFLKYSISSRIRVKCRNNRYLEGIIHAYDIHLNILLGPVKELVKSYVYDEVQDEIVEMINEKQYKLLVVRGDLVVSVSLVS